MVGGDVCKSAAMGGFDREAFSAYAEAHVPDWRDDERMGFMLDSFGVRAVDEERWAGRMRFWQTTIADFARRARCPVVTPRAMRDAMSRNGRHPRGLHVVLAELEKQGKLRPAEDLLQAASAESGADGGVGWAAWLLSKAGLGPARRALGPLLGGRGPAPQDVNELPEELLSRKYVLSDVVEALAEAAEEAAREADEAGAGAVLLLPDLAQRLALSSEAAELAVGLLCERRRAAVLPTGHDGRGERAVKFAARGAKTVRATETDRGIAHMRATSRLLARQIASLEARVRSLTERALAAVVERRQDDARRLLRERQPLKRLLEQREGTRLTLDGVLARIADAHLSAQLVEAYREGARALRATAAAGLTPERAEEATGELEDALADQREVDEALARGLAGPEGPGEEELAAELAAIERRTAEEAEEAAAAAAGGRPGAGVQQAPVGPPWPPPLARGRPQGAPPLVPAEGPASPQRTPASSREGQRQAALAL